MPSIALTAPSCIAPSPRQRRVLLVQRDHAAGEPLVLQRLAQHPGRDDRLAVVGEPERALRAQLGHLGELAAPQPAGDRGHEADGDARVAGGGVAQGAQDRRGVDDGVGVRHRDDGAVAARRGRAGAGLEVLLVLLAGRAQVDVRVDEGGEEVAPAAVDDLGARRGGEARRARRSRRSRPSRTRTSCAASIPARGSRTWAEAIRTSAGGAGAWTSARAGSKGRLVLMRSTAPRSARARSPSRRGPRRGPPSGRRPRTRPAS